MLEFDSENALNARYVHGGKVDEPLRMERDISPYRNESFPEQYFYYHKDRLGSITEITNSIGEVVQRYVYDSFGRVTIYDNQGNEITASSNKYLENPFTYTGREYDVETGLYYYRARYYNPETGRFISEDPIGFRDGDLNLYRYVGNNPVNQVDPSGNGVFTCIAALAVGKSVSFATAIKKAVSEGLSLTRRINELENRLRELEDSNNNNKMCKQEKDKAMDQADLIKGQIEELKKGLGGILSRLVTRALAIDVATSIAIGVCIATFPSSP